MAIDANWPRDIFGVDLNRAVPNANVALPGVVITRPSLRPLPIIEGLLPAPIIVTGDTDDIPAGTEYVIVQRSDPGTITTTLNFPSTLLQISPLVIFDWSEGFDQHTISCVAAGGETIMQEATFDMVSVDDGSFKQLTSGIFYPFSTLLGWGAR